uniref:Ureidoglycolate hydrolase n=1 Tax=Leersia perrieri TaxID=77586 RepID=A0A0D9V7G6_9ORYZ
MQTIHPGAPCCRLGRFYRRGAVAASASPPCLPPLVRGSSSKGGGAVRCGKAAAAAARSVQAAMEAVKEAAPAAKMVALRAVEATPESFAPFGQVIAATPDGDEFGPHDAQLDLSRGIPRFYIMRLEKRPLKFHTITHHASVTQCLGSIGGEDWYLGVARPSIVEDGAQEHGGDGRKPVQSRAGHYYLPPDPAEVRVFRVSGAKFLKLHIGTWHAGPQFKADAVDFYNLELSNTNIVDHTTHDFKKDDGVTFVIED